MTEKSFADCFDRNFAEIKDRISAAAEKSGRSASDIILLAATKTVPSENINYAVSKGISYIGENRVQEMLSKDDAVDRTVHRHFIGHLQTNKVKDVINRVEMIESVDSLHLAEKIGAECEKCGKTMDILLEVNIGNEESKSGFAPIEIYTVLEEVEKISGVRVRGIMSIPPVCTDKTVQKAFFRQLYDIFVDIRSKKTDNRDILYLSMGMSDDYDLAVECGANIVRIGTALFGKRN